MLGAMWHGKKLLKLIFFQEQEVFYFFYTTAFNQQIHFLID